MKFFIIFSMLIFFYGCSKGGDKVFVNPKSDPLVEYMWHLKDSTTPYISGDTPAAGTHINLANTHNNFDGSGVRIVVSDGRIDLDHPELAGNSNLSLSKNYALTAPYFGNPRTNDNTDSHGTGVASLALGGKNNNTGGYGVAPGATLVGYQYIGNSTTLAVMIDNAQIQDGGAVFNYSWGPMNCSIETGGGKNYLDQIRYHSVVDKNFYLVAAGNEFRRNHEDGGCGGTGEYLGNANFDQDRTSPYFVLIGATNAQGVAAKYTTPGVNVWVSAPGGDTGASNIGLMVADLVGCGKGFNLLSPFSFDLYSSTNNPDCGYFSYAQGTSYSSPIAAGVVALMKQANPELSWRDIKHILASTALKIDPMAAGTTHPMGQNLAGHTYQNGWVQNNAGFFFHPRFGFGLINTSAAVAKALASDFELKDLRSSDRLNDSPSYTSSVVQPIPDNSSVGLSSTINVGSHNLQIEHVLVTVNITHSRISDIGIELTSPAGTTMKLMNINSNIVGSNMVDVKFGVNGFYGERSKGNWSIKVVDGSPSLAGSFLNWSITIIGNRGGDLNDVNPPASVTSVARVGASLSWTAPADTDIARYEICMFPTAQAEFGCRDGDWRSINTGTSVTLGKYIISGLVGQIDSGQHYQARIRAVDTSENVSSNNIFSWTHP